MKPIISPNSSPSFNSPPPYMATTASAWPSSNHHILNSRPIEDDFFNMSALLSPPKSGVEKLMQNCDLPPPTKLYSGPDQRAFNYMGKEDQDKDDQEARTDFDDSFMDVYETEKLVLSKALRLSQTRAREAEKKAEDLVKEKEMICNGFLRESMQLLAHRHLVRLLEIQLWKIQKQQETSKNSTNSDGDHKKGNDCEEIDGFSWFAALAICLGIAFGCRYFF